MLLERLDGHHVWKRLHDSLESADDAQIHLRASGWKLVEGGGQCPIPLELQDEWDELNELEARLDAAVWGYPSLSEGWGREERAGSKS
jgi:hypothetical protein